MTPVLPRVLAVAGLVLAACGGGAAGQAGPSPTASAVPTAAQSVAPAPATAAGTWTVASASKATVSVREQLVGVNLPSDAVLVATGATGSFGLNADGTFTAASKITFDLATLASDQRQRDDFVKRSVLQTGQFPTASFVPTKATGLTLPVADGADLAFTLTGKMTVHGVTKDVTFAVVARRTGGQLTATATAQPAWKFADFGMSAPSVPLRVVSVTDEIRVAVQIVATQ